MKAKTISRRAFLKTSAVTAGATAATLGLLAEAGAADKKKIPFALQLYSVRNECAKDLVGTIHAVGKMGYKAVEFAGYHGRDAKTLRQLLDDAGLKCCGTHIGLDTLLGEQLPKTVAFNQTLGNTFLIVPSLPEKYHKTRQAWLEAADIFNELADKVKPDGMRVGYHNHNIEFKPLDDELPWPEIFHICETVGGTEWYIIEYESDAFPPLVSVEKTLGVMRRWGKC